jgi:hypothetical protein
MEPPAGPLIGPREDQPVSHPTARPPLPPDRSPWLLGPAEIAAVQADDQLLDRRAHGDQPGPNDPDPTVAALAAWRREVEIGGAQ